MKDPRCDTETTGRLRAAQAHFEGQADVLVLASCLGMLCLALAFGLAVLV